MERLADLWLDGRHDQLHRHSSHHLRPRDHARRRRARQDRTPRRRAPRRHWAATSAGVALHHPGVRLERPRHLACRARRHASRLRARTSPTSRSPVRPTPSPPSPRSRTRTASSGSCCCRAGANRQHKRAKRSCWPPASPRRSSGAASSPRTSASTSFVTPSSKGVIAFPAGAAREPIVDADDIADVAVRVAHRAGPRATRLRVDRPPVAVVHRDGGRPQRRPPDARSSTCRSRPTSTQPGRSRLDSPLLKRRCSPLCSATSSTATTSR